MGDRLQRLEATDRPAEVDDDGTRPSATGPPPGRITRALTHAITRTADVLVHALGEIGRVGKAAHKAWRRWEWLLSQTGRARPSTKVAVAAAVVVSAVATLMRGTWPPF